MERILVVDDEERILLSFRRFLKDKGYQVLTAGNGEEAISAVSGNDINLIIMDINMPGINGLEAFQKIKENKPKIPIKYMCLYLHLRSRRPEPRALPYGEYGYAYT